MNSFKNFKLNYFNIKIIFEYFYSIFHKKIIHIIHNINFIDYYYDYYI